MNSADQHRKFVFLEPGSLQDGDLRLVLEACEAADPEKGYVPCYKFKICLGDSEEKKGNVDFRAGLTHDLVMYGGHLAYGVDPKFRGRQLAARACRLLFPFAKAHGFSELWITCNPDNWASRKTCERIGAELVEIVNLPEHIDMYQEGERQKCRYRLKI